VGKSQAATGQGSVESSARAKGGGLREWKGRESRRHKVGCMLIRLRMKSATAGVNRKIIFWYVPINVSTFIFLISI
jgi:hypothetical protein